MLVPYKILRGTTANGVTNFVRVKQEYKLSRDSSTRFPFPTSR